MATWTSRKSPSGSLKQEPKPTSLSCGVPACRHRSLLHLSRCPSQVQCFRGSGHNISPLVPYASVAPPNEFELGITVEFEEARGVPPRKSAPLDNPAGGRVHDNLVTPSPTPEPLVLAYETICSRNPLRIQPLSLLPSSKDAVDLFVYRIERELGSLAAALGGLDAIVFTAGNGEHAAKIRKPVPAPAWPEEPHVQGRIDGHSGGALRNAKASRAALSRSRIKPNP